MKIEIKKTTNEYGRIYLKINDKAPNYKLSRELTGTLEETDNGIFTSDKSVKMFYGSYSKIFQFRQISEEMDIDKISKNLKYNIFIVNSWVNSCKLKAKTEIIRFDTSDSYFSSKTINRDAKGRFAKK